MVDINTGLDCSVGDEREREQRQHPAVEGGGSYRLETPVTDTLSSGQEVGTSHRYMARLHHTLVTNIYQTVKYRQTQQYYLHLGCINIPITIYSEYYRQSIIQF